ncbi:hypothetical protein Tco_0434759 [Tanacetum coccineum]
MSHLRRAIMEEHRASMEAYKKVHNETVRSELRMEIVQQSMEIDMWEIKEKLVERREQMAISAYEEDKRREEWIQKIEEDKRREEWNQRMEEVINLIQSFIRNPISPIKTPQPVTMVNLGVVAKFTWSRDQVYLEWWPRVLLGVQGGDGGGRVLARW